MALLEGDERSEMPSMSWDSVVGGSTANTGRTTPTDIPGTEVEDIVEPPAPPPVAFSTLSLTLDAPTAMTPPVDASAPLVPPARPIPAAPSSTASVAPPPPSPAETAAVARPELQELSIPRFDDLLDHTSQPIRAESEPLPEPLPVIVEATSPPIVPTPVEAVGAAPTPAAPSPAAPSPAAEPAPVVVPATQPNQTLTLPPVVVAPPQASVHLVGAPSTGARAPRKDRSGSIARIGFFFLIVAALASAAVLFGRPYLFPAEWEANALEFAEPIELARGTEFIEPVLLTPQATGSHVSMVAAQLLGAPAAELPMWRALGLAGSDSTDDATLQALISEQSPVLYSTVDGQVYYDQGFTRSDRDVLIFRAMATAALDQEYSFSADQANRSLDDAALTEAHVRQQATLIQQTASNSAPPPAADMAALAFLPAVLDYRLTAPAVFTNLLPPVDDVAPNPLTDLGTAGPGPLTVSPLAQIPSTPSAVGDTAVGPALLTDRSFWYLSFASHLDATTAYRMSTQLRSAGLQMVDGPTGRCAVATFGTVDAATNAALQADLDVWVAATAPELGASVSALPDTSVQLRSCDPTGPYSSNVRFGVARELIAWRAIELAVTNLVVGEGGTDVDITAAAARVGSTPSAVAVAQLPAGTAPADLAAAALAAANDVIVAAQAPVEVAVDPVAVDPASSGGG